ncbi:acyltransferase family protein [Ningiella sp. W23]|uniref:acyltransferase family protein n=1 Tax=Ningiella sp. W23 TaxID=3023715 RepID=UPI003757049F
MPSNAVSAHENIERLHYLDAVRAFALLLGIVFHASISFLPVFIGWAVMDISTSDIVGVFMLMSHSFRMPLFFLISGFFSHLVFHRIGATRYIQSRLIRLAVPFVVGWFFLKPLLISAWIMGHDSMRGDVSLSHALFGSLASFTAMPEGLFTGTHLWFLYYLLMISGIVVLVSLMLGQSSTFSKRIKRAMDRAVQLTVQSRCIVLFLAIPTAVCLWFMNHWGLDTPDKSLIPHLPTLSIYGMCFALGWLLRRQKKVFEQFVCFTKRNFIVCIIAAVSLVYLSNFEPQYSHPQYDVLKLGFIFSYALMMWSLIIASIAAFKHVFAKPNKIIRYLADASYWIYLIHLPIVIWLQIAFAELPLHWLVKLTSIVIISIGLSLILYAVFVRFTWLGATLNGSRKPRLAS